MVTAKLLHIECGRFNGMAVYEIGEKIFRFDLCCPAYNDFNEYRVSPEFECYDDTADEIMYYEASKYIDRYKKGNVPEAHDILLSAQQYEWWLNKDREKSAYMNDLEVCGSTSENRTFIVYDGSIESWTLFNTWKQKESHAAFDWLLFNILCYFYNAHQNKIIGNGRDILIFSELS